MNDWFTLHLVRPYIAHELPGWGHVYRVFVGSYESNRAWENAGPRLVRDKICGYYRIADLREWADRSLFFLKRWYDLTTSLLVQDLVRPGQAVVDVGANYGHFSMAAAAAVGPGGRVTSFEPNPVSFARLRTHVALNRLAQVQAIQMGIADRAEVLTLNVPQINSGEASFGGAAYETGYEVDCRVDALDTLLAGERVDFLKIDVEGFECRVLRGARDLIGRCRPLILTEIVDTHLERAGASRAELFGLMREMGYRPFSIALTGRGARRRVSLAALSEAGFAAHPTDSDVLWQPDERDTP